MPRIQILAVVILIGSSGLAQEEPGRTTQPATATQPSSEGQVPVVSKERPMSFWMAKKLDYSKSILESLTKGDYDQLAQDAERLRIIGRMEGFVRRKNPTYRLHLGTFDAANRELVRHAQNGNPEGATLAFNQLTISCVNCHLLIRESPE